MSAHALKTLHRKQGDGVSLKTFARKLKDNEDARAWLAHKAGPPKKPTAPKPAPAAPAPVAAKSVLKKK